MRIHWTTRIAMAVGVVTLIAGIVAGSGPARATQAGSHAAGYVAGATTR
jgi:hypothetical protein